MSTGNSNNERSNIPLEIPVPAHTDAPASRSTAPLLSHSELVSELYNDFGSMDKSNRGSIHLYEVEGFLTIPHLSESEQELGHFLKDNFTALARMSGSGSDDEISKSGIDHMKEVFADSAGQEPSTTIISRGALGGAAGGAVSAYLKGQPVRPAFNRGVGVGATIGILAYAAEKSDYDQLQADRAVAAGLKYPQHRFTDPAQEAKLTDEQIAKLGKGFELP